MLTRKARDRMEAVKREEREKKKVLLVKTKEIGDLKAKLQELQNANTEKRRAFDELEAEVYYKERELREKHDRLEGAMSRLQDIMREFTVHKNNLAKLKKKIGKFQEESMPETKPLFSMPECGICMLDYADIPNRMPRVLDCGHSLCEECIERTVDLEAIFGGDPSGDLVFKCPYDRTLVVLGKGLVTSLPKNHDICKIINTCT